MINRSIAEDFFRSVVAHDVTKLTTKEAPGLITELEALSSKAGVSTPSLYLSPSSWPNAGMHGMTGSMLIHDGLLSLTGDHNLMGRPSDELRTIMAHELGHYKRKDHITMALAVGAMPLVATVAYNLYEDAKKKISDNKVTGTDLTLTSAISEVAAERIKEGFTGAAKLLGFKKLPPKNSAAEEKDFIIDPEWKAHIIEQGKQLAINAAGLGAGLIVARQLALRNEFRADKFAVELTGNPEAYISALSKLEKYTENALRSTARTSSQQASAVSIIERLKAGVHSIIEETIGAHPPLKDRIREIRKLYLPQSQEMARL